MSQISPTRPALDPDALLRVPRLGGTALSPDGTQVAFAWNRDGQFQLYVVSVAGGEPRQLTSAGDAVQTPLWTPDGTHILFRRDGPPGENGELYRDRSAINFIEQVRRPLLILQGGRDPRVPLAGAEQMRDRLAAAGKTYDYHVYPDEGHGFRRVENFADALYRTVGFFDTHTVE